MLIYASASCRIVTQTKDCLLQYTFVRQMTYSQAGKALPTKEDPLPLVSGKGSSHTMLGMVCSNLRWNWRAVRAMQRVVSRAPVNEYTDRQASRPK